MRRSSFLETQTILRALEFASGKGGFSNNAKMKKMAQSLIKEMKSNKTISGRQQQLETLLKKGATLGEMVRATGASRRTVFRYLNHFEDAGLTLTLAGNRYRLP